MLSTSDPLTGAWSPRCGKARSVTASWWEGVRRYAIFLLGPSGAILTWNQGVQELLGFTREEFVGHSGAICFNPKAQAADAFAKELADAARDGERMEDLSAAHKDGTVFGVHDIVTALRNGAGTLIGFAKVIRELGPRESASEQLVKTAGKL